MNRIATGPRMPRNLPRTKSRRLIGLHSTVRAVRPSISSASETLAVQRARTIDSNITSVRPFSSTTLVSSPKVKYGRYKERNQQKDPESQQNVEQRLQDGFFARRPGDGGNLGKRRRNRVNNTASAATAAIPPQPISQNGLTHAGAFTKSKKARGSDNA